MVIGHSKDSLSRNSVNMWIKICGIRMVEVAKVVMDAGADAIGLNFFSASPRHVSTKDAKAICDSVGDEIETVGLFVNHSLQQIVDVVQQTGLRTIQLHGDESQEFCTSVQAACPDCTIIRALRPGDKPIEEIEHALGPDITSRPARILIDARVKGVYGGSGHTVNWPAFAVGQRLATWPDFILAGGLTPANIVEAVSIVQPWGVDIASGVEVDGRKDPQLIGEFIAAARSV